MVAKPEVHPKPKTRKSRSGAAKAILAPRLDEEEKDDKKGDLEDDEK